MWEYSYQNKLTLAGIYLLKVNNRITSQWRRSGVFIVNFEHTSQLVPRFQLLAFEYVTAGWDYPI